MLTRNVCEEKHSKSENLWTSLGKMPFAKYLKDLIPLPRKNWEQGEEMLCSAPGAVHWALKPQSWYPHLSFGLAYLLCTIFKFNANAARSSTVVPALNRAVSEANNSNWRLVNWWTPFLQEDGDYFNRIQHCIINDRLEIIVIISIYV